MEKPDLNRMWETWIIICPKTEIDYLIFQKAIRDKISKLFEFFKGTENIEWYHFLYHNNPSDKSNAYFHVRFSTKKTVKDSKELNLPNFCIMTKKLPLTRNISGINKSLIKNDEIEEAWRILGKQSEWVVNLINIHKPGLEIPTDQIVQFLHFFLNMFLLGRRAQIKNGYGKCFIF